MVPTSIYHYSAFPAHHFTSHSCFHAQHLSNSAELAKLAFFSNSDPVSSKSIPLQPLPSESTSSPMTSPGQADTFPRARRPSLQMPGASPQTGSSPRAIPSTASSPRSASISTSPRAVPVAASPRAVPLPVPQRHGSVNRGSFGSLSEAAAFSPRQWNSHRRGSGSLSGSVSLSSSFVLEPEMTDQTDGWLDVPAADVAKEAAVVVAGDMGLEQATEVCSVCPNVADQTPDSSGESRSQHTGAKRLYFRAVRCMSSR